MPLTNLEPILVAASLADAAMEGAVYRHPVRFVRHRPGLCWNKRQGEGQLSIGVDFAEDLEEPPTWYWVRLSGKRDGSGGWCT